MKATKYLILLCFLCFGGLVPSPLRAAEEGTSPPTPETTTSPETQPTAGPTCTLSGNEKLAFYLSSTFIGVFESFEIGKDTDGNTIMIIKGGLFPRMVVAAWVNSSSSTQPLKVRYDLSFYEFADGKILDEKAKFIVTDLVDGEIAAATDNPNCLIIKSLIIRVDKIYP